MLLSLFKNLNYAPDRPTSPIFSFPIIIRDCIPVKRMDFLGMLLAWDEAQITCPAGFPDAPVAFSEHEADGRFHIEPFDKPSFKRWKMIHAISPN